LRGDSHIQPTGVLGDIMELKPTQYTPRLTSGEGLIERTGRVRRQIIEHDPDAVRFGKVKVGKLAHAGGEVHGGTAVSHLDLAPGPMRVEEDEQVDGAIALILAVVTLDLARLGRDRLADLANELGRGLIETDNRRLASGASA
jgi:hypothetical protein